LHAKAERAILYEVRSARLSLWVGILERGLLRLNSSNPAFSFTDFAIWKSGIRMLVSGAQLLRRQWPPA
jgi:hypothetical protein